jgi:hypothetical protein
MKRNEPFLKKRKEMGPLNNTAMTVPCLTSCNSKLNVGHLNMYDKFGVIPAHTKLLSQLEEIQAVVSPWDAYGGIREEGNVLCLTCNVTSITI